MFARRVLKGCWRSRSRFARPRSRRRSSTKPSMSRSGIFASAPENEPLRPAIDTSWICSTTFPEEHHDESFLAFPREIGEQAVAPGNGCARPCVVCRSIRSEFSGGRWLHVWSLVAVLHGDVDGIPSESAAFATQQ